MTRSRLRDVVLYAVLGFWCAGPLLFSYPAAAQEFYRWVDDKGAVHFTDNLYSVPEKYRSQIEKRSYVPTPEPAAPETAPAAPSPGRPSAPSQALRYIVPFTRSEGNHVLVQGVVNGRAVVRFILDTGAGSSMIPRSAASQAGIDIDRGLVITAAGVGGAVDVPLVEIDSINVGGAEVRNLEVTVQDLFGGKLDSVGLLGADFLLEYRVDIQYAQNRVVLERQEGPYGGHSFEWWQQRFRRYAAHKRSLEAGRGRAESQAARDLLDRQLRNLETKIGDLEVRASQAGIPREFRQ